MTVLRARLGQGVVRLAARLPFLFIAGRMYGAEALGRFAYAVLVVEFVAQLSTLGLKRGLAQQLSKTDKPHVCITWDALLVAFTAAVLALTTGNVGTLLRLRGLVTPYLIWLSALGLCALLESWLRSRAPRRVAHSPLAPEGLVP